MKRHARLQGDAGRLLWVGDDTDWNLMRAEPRPQLLCPQQGCGDALHAVRNDRGTRFLRRTGTGGGGSRGGCDHWWVSGSAGGPESSRHLWLKARLAAICLHLGWAAVPEDPATYADVWVPDARLALEVQLRRTDTLGRTAARLAAGAAGVIWFIAEDVAARKTLFGAPAVRCLVVAADGRSGPAQPWCDPGAAARLVVGATVWRWEGWRLGTAPMSGYRFLSEVLGGQRGWCPPGTPGMPQGRGGWVRWTDLALAMGRPGLPVGVLAEEVPLAAAHYLDAQCRQRPAARRRTAERG